MSRVTTSFQDILFGERDMVGVDFAARMDVGDALAGVSCTVRLLQGADPTPALLLNGPAQANGTFLLQPIMPRVDGATYELHFVAEITGTKALHHIAILRVVPVVPVASGSLLFPSRLAAVATLRSDRLVLASKGSLPAELSDDYLWLKLQAAEAEVGRKLGCFMRPTEVFSVKEPDAAVIAALGGRPYVVDPGYDLPPDFFQIGQFGALKLTRPLVSKVTAVSLVHPSLNGTVYSIPPSWVLLVGRSGWINILPGSGASTLPLSLFTLQAMGSGYTIPQMIQVQYTAGLSPTHELWPEVLDATQRLAVLLALQDAFLPQSGSISADGLSRSISLDLSKHQETLDARLDGLRDRIVGVVWGVL